MMPLSPSSGLYFFKNSSAPENATCAMYFLTSSAVMPMPLSVKVSVPFSASATTSMRQGASPSSGARLASPIEIRRFILLTASQPLETSSRTNISLSEYSHFLMTGMIFSALMEIVPRSAILIASMFLIA